MVNFFHYSSFKLESFYYPGTKKCVVCLVDCPPKKTGWHFRKKKEGEKRDGDRGLQRRRMRRRGRGRFNHKIIKKLLKYGVEIIRLLCLPTL